MTWLLPPNKYHRIWIIGVRIEIGLALFTETLFLCKARDTMAKAFFPVGMEIHHSGWHACLRELRENKKVSSLGSWGESAVKGFTASCFGSVPGFILLPIIAWDSEPGILKDMCALAYSILTSWHIFSYVVQYCMVTSDSMLHRIVIAGLEQIVTMDSLSAGRSMASPTDEERSPNSHMSKPLPGSLLGLQLERQWEPLSEVSENIIHWSHLPMLQNTLWVTSDSEETCHRIACAASHRLSADEREPRVALVDVSHTQSVFWPLVLGLAKISPEYATQFRVNAPPILATSCKWCLGVPEGFWTKSKLSQSSLWEGLGDEWTIVWTLFIQPLRKMYQQKTSQDTPDVNVPRAIDILIVHGLRDTMQAEQMWRLCDKLKWSPERHPNAPAIVIVSKPALLSRTLVAAKGVADKTRTNLRRDFCMMHLSATGLILYSGCSPTPPPLCVNLFMVWVDAVHQIGGSEAERMWPSVLKVSSDGNADLEESESATTVLFSKLHKAVETRHQIMQYLSKMPHMKQSHILESVGYDNLHIANQLQALFELDHDNSTNVSKEARKLRELNYRQRLSTVPREHAVTVLNITHAILDEYPKHGEILHYEVFSRHAHHLLNVLAAQLELLPDKLVLTNVIVAGTHPIASGGYSNIYRGQYQDHDGKEVQVALKVLKIFEDQLEEEQHRLHLKFAKEALVWYYLRHPNIVPFLGVDSTTFPSPSRAMVSPWMVQGSVLKYMARNSPVAPYAVQLLNDIISGLNYLHSVNIVHGDLCGRNILINEHGRASLTDFGLAGLIESEPTLRTTTRGGSLRWQPPELILPGVPFRRTMASDVWAFGCVCGEIWTEGTTPFSHFPTDSSIILGLQQAPTEQPYQTQPTDRQGTSMPDSLWDLVQRCWRYNVLERPMGNVMVDVLARITNRELPGHRHEDKGSLELLSLGGAGQAEGGQSLPLELSTSPTLPSRIVQGSVAKAMDKPLPAIPVDPQESLSDE